MINLKGWGWRLIAAPIFVVSWLLSRHPVALLAIGEIVAVFILMAVLAVLL